MQLSEAKNGSSLEIFELKSKIEKLSEENSRLQGIFEMNLCLYKNVLPVLTHD